jgi:hypothetical protein
MTSMPHLASVAYTHRDQMRRADVGAGRARELVAVLRHASKPEDQVDEAGHHGVDEKSPAQVRSPHPPVGPAVGEATSAQ